MLGKWFKAFKDFFSEISIECYGICVYLMCLPYTIVETPFGSLLKVITMPVIGILVYKLFFGKCKKLCFNSVHLSYSIYMLYTVGGLLILFNELSVVTTKDMALGYITIILMTMRYYTEKERTLIDYSWIVLGVNCIYLGLFCTQAIRGGDRQFVVIGNNYEDPNQFCTYFLMPMVLCVKYILKKPKLRPLYTALILLMLYAMMKGGSRGGMIAIVVAVGTYAFIGVKGFGKKVVMIVAGVLCVAIVVGVIFPLLPEEIRSRYSVESVVEDGGSGRFDIWKYLVEYTIEKPERIIRGEGLYSTVYSLSISRVNDVAKGAHNQFVQVFADQGIVGIVLYLLWSAACFFQSIKKSPEYSCAFLGLMALAFSLSFYTFKPMINVVIMCALMIEDEDEKIDSAKEAI